LTRNNARLAIACSIIALAIASYWPVVHAGFIMDDEVMLTNNPLIKAPDGLLRMWTTQAVDYWPITGTSLWIEWRLWGASAAGYHVTNLLLHIGCGLLLWRVLSRLRIQGAALAGFLFAVHPVTVQSVAWISERKNTLSLLFCLLALAFFFHDRPASGKVGETSATGRAVQRSRGPQSREPTPPDEYHRRAYWLSLLAFVLAMLSKGSVATLPVILLLVLWWRNGTVSRRDLFRTIPFFVVGMLLTAVNIWFQARNAGGVIREAGLLDRVLGGGAVVWFYLSKAVFPVRLMFIYPQWQITFLDWRWWLPLLAALAATVGLWRFRRHRAARALLFAWSVFCVALVPVLGLTDVQFMRFSLVSDHYQYVALAAVMASAATGLARLPGRSARITGAVLVGLLAMLTWRQAGLYADGRTLYERTVEDNPAAWPAHNNLAMLDLHASPPRVTDAIEHLRAAISVNPENPMLHHNLGEALFEHGDFEAAAAEQLKGMAGAVDHLRATVAANPADPTQHNDLGTALFLQGDLEGALAEHREAVRLSPRYGQAYAGMGDDLLRLGRTQDAIDAYERALEIEPTLTSVRTNLGHALNLSGKTEAAAEHLKRALANASAADDPLALADSLLQLGKTDLAVERYRAILAQRPSSVHALNNLGYALTLLGRLDEAEVPLRQVIRLQPEHAGAHDNLGNVLRQRGQLDAAIHEFDLALEHASGMELARIHNDLGITLAQAGDLPGAVDHFRAALRLNPQFKAAEANLARAVAQPRRPQ
jgi:tetratricopeptide (TPR) repeat protein